MATSPETRIPVRGQFSLATLFALVTAAAMTLGLQAALPSMFAAIENIGRHPPDVPWELEMLAVLANLFCMLCSLCAPLVLAFIAVCVRRQSFFLTCYAGAVFSAIAIIALAFVGVPPMEHVMPFLLGMSYAAILVFAVFGLGESYLKGLSTRCKLVCLAAIFAWLCGPLGAFFSGSIPDR